MGRIAYAWFAAPQALLYATLGYQLFRHVGIEQRFFSIIVPTALCEAIVGWSFAWWIGPAKPAKFATLPSHVKTTTIAGSILIGLTYGLIFSYTGACLAKYLPHA